ncbi:(d)CMP kinase [Compostibacter hankyongensis]|uniref:Cytidylate kinase n=1 Tax=Compostibacter hankyongensis TaxID=1007089 RepID=A0ABP8FXP8_9BACT
MKKIIIAIDGYSSCGKSTLARQLARELHYTYLDSGAMYRAITLYLIREKISPEDEKAVEQALRQITLSFVPDPAGGTAHMCLNGEDVEHPIRDMEVAGKVSAVAAIGAVRRFAVAQQQRMGRDKGIVMDGRDIGTVVFPDAELKLFMTADPEVRALRRYKELKAKNLSVTLEAVRENLRQRDHLDETRAISPLRKAPDAVVLDNSHMTAAEQLVFALNQVAEKCPAVGGL